MILLKLCQQIVSFSRYVVMDLIRDLADHLVEKCRKIPNFCVIYDQLLKLATLIEESQILPESSESLKSLIESSESLKSLIAARFSKACASASFKEISEGTLVSILSFHMLNISELDLLKVCLKWTEHKMVSQKLEANQSKKQKIFEPIKRLLRFHDLSVADFSSIRGLDDYLSLEEITKLFLALSHPCNPLPIEYQSPRMGGKIRVARSRRGHAVFNSVQELSVNCPKKICLCSIETIPMFSNYDLRFRFFQDKKEFSPDVKVVPITENDNQKKSWIFDFSHSICVFEPNTNFKLFLRFSKIKPSQYSYVLGASQDLTLKSDEGDVFEISALFDHSDLGGHCIKSIEYWSM